MSWSIYDDLIYGPELRKLFKNDRKSTRHQETCPICNRTNVNIYKKDMTWKCKKCWDEDVV